MLEGEQVDDGKQTKEEDERVEEWELLEGERVN